MVSEVDGTAFPKAEGDGGVDQDQITKGAAFLATEDSLEDGGIHGRVAHHDAFGWRCWKVGVQNTFHGGLAAFNQKVASWPFDADLIEVWIAPDDQGALAAQVFKGTGNNLGGSAVDAACHLM